MSTFPPPGYIMVKSGYYYALVNVVRAIRAGNFAGLAEALDLLVLVEGISNVNAASSPPDTGVSQAG